MENNENQAPEKRVGIKRYIPLIVIVVIVVVGIIIWYRDYSRYISTDDAHIDSDNVSISSKILGRISRLYADEGDSVQKGMLLAELDSTDLLAQKQQFMASKEQNIATQAQDQAKYESDQENIKATQVEFDKNQDDFNRAQQQYAGQVITKQDFDHAQKNFEAAKVKLDVAKKQLTVSQAQIKRDIAAVEFSKAQIGTVLTQISNTRLYAPFSGIIARRWLLPGDIAQPGQSIFTLTNDKKLWVAVYLEETKVAQVHLNQKAQFTIDAFPGVKFTGKVYSIGSNTASQFSLIPPNNASGNFTKVTQRVPLKISIDGTTDNKDLAQFNILAGMSAVIKIIKEQ